MNADLLVELPGHGPCFVARHEFIPLLREKGWHEVSPGVWEAPTGNEPDAAFADLSRSLTPRRGRVLGEGERDPRINLPTFRRHHSRGVAVWALH